jgi:SAM-dependent methyltransferase
MQSKNPHWTLNSFHADITALAGIKDGDRVLDLGCGRGNTIPHLHSKIGTTGEVVAADRNGSSLEAVRARFAEEVIAGRLSLIELDIVQRLPFTDGSFDSVICQNVIECIPDKSGLLREIYRILKPQGSALISHHDFDGAIIASDDRELTRRLVHGYADHVQEWQDVSDGQMGRLLPGLVAVSPFEHAETGIQLYVDLVLTKESYARIHLDGMVALAAKFGIAGESAAAWLRDLEARSDLNAFYYALPWVYVLASKGAGRS